PATGHGVRAGPLRVVRPWGGRPNGGHRLSGGTLTPDAGGHGVLMRRLVTLSAAVLLWSLLLPSPTNAGVRSPSGPCAAPTISGTNGKDMIEGTDGPDVIAGLGGDDTIYAKDGDDI